MPPEVCDVLDCLADRGLQDIHAPHAAHAAAIVPLLLMGDRPFVWVEDARTRAETGTARLHMMGHGTDGTVLHEAIVTRARQAREVLWVMEEAVKAGIPVVGEIAGAPRVLDFTATRRLELFSRANDVPCFLVRIGTDVPASGSSGARWRWRMHHHPAAPHPLDPRAPGPARRVLELVRARSRPPGRWIVETQANETGAPHRVRVVAALADGNVDARPEPREGARLIPFRTGRAA